ncbi:MAG: hypothetical protein RR436_05705 [Clostridia bacterium]
MNSSDLKNIAQSIDSKKLKNVSDILSKTIGISENQITSFLNDTEKLDEIAKMIKPSDIEKLSILLDNPNLLTEILSSKKASEKIKDFID